MTTKMHIRSLLIFSVLFFYSPILKAQQLLPVNEKTYADSLAGIANSRVSDSLKADANFLLVDFWRAKDTLKSKSFLQKAKMLSQKYPYLKASYFFYEGQYFQNWDKEKAAASYQKAQKALQKFNTKASLLLQASAWYNYGIVKKDKEGYPFVMDILTKHAIPLAEKAGDKEKQAHYYSQFGTILMYNAQFAKAAAYHQKAIDLLSKGFPNSSTLVLAYIGASNNFIYADKKDQAKKMLDAAKAILAPYPKSINYSFYYLNECHYELSKNHFEEALESAAKGIELSRKNNQTDLLQLFYFRKYEIFQHQKRYHEARTVLMDLLKEGKLVKDANNKKTIYSELAKINELLGNKGEAFSWLKQYSTLSDSLSGIRLHETVTGLEAKYANSENQKQIATLKSEKSEQQLEANKNKQYVWILIGISLLLLLIAGFSYVYYLSNKKLIGQKEINHQQEINKRKQQEQLKITKAMLDGEEKERERIAKELHDGLGGMLAGVKINFSGWGSKTLSSEQREDFDKILRQLDKSVGELRGVARNLMPESLLKFGLETALKDLSEFYMNDDLEIDLQTYTINAAIPLSMQLHIYRIVQELLSNAIKHSKATNILLQCSQNKKNFFITLEDNGIGFNLEDLKHKKGMGIHNVQNRVDYLKGKFEINSQHGEGTTVNIELKINGN
ncbi:sensor histidine kinase [uncultured Flavobacterium sp.]|uniref:tetratricopeptide repeat-containing sensor histidine kinase n=1 Tax=uncultured Flavobacterium sp. TaxID=165435 RepID=UPI0025D9ADF8|nr:sensor histidine kinase [uncultured Flavobacterium sp.]